MTHMPTINRGRVNNGADVLRELHAETFGQVPSRIDMSWYRMVVSVVLSADDRYLARVTAVADGRLREHLGKAHQEISRLGQEIERLNHRMRDANDRRRKADAAIAEAELEKRKAESWRLSAEANTKAFNIVRAQLEEAGIEIDRRVR